MNLRFNNIEVREHKWKANKETSINLGYITGIPYSRKEPTHKKNDFSLSRLFLESPENTSIW